MFRRPNLAPLLRRAAPTIPSTTARVLPLNVVAEINEGTLGSTALRISALPIK